GTVLRHGDERVAAVRGGVDGITGFGEILREDRDEIRFVVHHENAARSPSVAHLPMIIAPAPSRSYVDCWGSAGCLSRGGEAVEFAALRGGLPGLRGLGGLHGFERDAELGRRRRLVEPERVA